MDKIKEIIGRAFKSEQEKRLMGAAVLVLIGLCIFIMAISPLVGASPIIIERRGRNAGGMWQ